MSNSDAKNTPVEVTVTTPKPKEKKKIPGVLESSILLPGAVIAGSLLVVATGIGIFRMLSNKKKSSPPKATKLDQ
jgi:hypothetical protein